MGASLVALEALGQAISAAEPLAWLRKENGPEGEEEGDRKALDTVFIHDVCAGWRPEGQGAGGLLSVPQPQVIGKVTKQTGGEADRWGLWNTQQGPWPGATRSVTPVLVPSPD